MVEEMAQISDIITPTDNHVMVHMPCGELTIAEKIQPMPRQRLMCYNCRTLLEFIVGPQQVQCSKCSAVNKLPKPKFQKKPCLNCKVMLQFDINAKKIKCGSCRFINEYE